MSGIQSNKWVLWLLMSALAGLYLGFAIAGTKQTLFLPGATSDGHYQIELACKECHGEGFEDEMTLQNACTRCHGDELNMVEDSHPRKKFIDPRNAERVAKIDATLCVTCHGEHRPRYTGRMGVTVPKDFCVLCHADIARERKSHEDFSFDGCDSAGCHNFHDNKALYEDFLVKHESGADHASQSRVAEKNFAEFYQRVNQIAQSPALSVADMDAPPDIVVNPAIHLDWQGSRHAAGGVNCLDCHAQSKSDSAWVAAPTQDVCKRCHESELNGFMTGKHGMRMAVGLSAMSPNLARLPMKTDARTLSLTCNSCHGGHRYDTVKASVDACLGCHDDDHSQAYKRSPHYKTVVRFSRAPTASTSAVTCATCHMPRVDVKERGESRILVQHNQSNNLRPNEKMIRGVCMNCHGLRFSIDALADEKLIETNFDGRSDQFVKSVEMAMIRERSGEKRKEEANN